MKAKRILKFGKGKNNSKLSKLEKKINAVVATFSLPSGWSCCGAKDCLSKANRDTGKIKDGKETKFRCFQASIEGLYPSLRASTWHNFDLIKTAIKSAWRHGKCQRNAIASLIIESLPQKYDVIRVHVGGDFFSQVYFDSWMEVARRNPDKLFYAYTKSLKFWLHRIDSIPHNFSLTASRGGKYDHLISLHKLKEAKVVFSERQAKVEGLKIDGDDSLALRSKTSFALLLHGTQPKGSDASKALQEIKRNKKEKIAA